MGLSRGEDGHCPDAHEGDAAERAVQQIAERRLGVVEVGVQQRDRPRRQIGGVEEIARAGTDIEVATAGVGPAVAGHHRPGTPPYPAEVEAEDERVVDGQEPARIDLVLRRADHRLGLISRHAARLPLGIMTRKPLHDVYPSWA